MYKIQDGNTFNVPVPIYYVESDLQLSEIPDTAPAGTIAEVNEEGNFHLAIKMENNEWNII